MSFPEDSWVEVRYPLTSEQEHGDRAAWPWLPGWVVSECGPGEWEICVQAPELAIPDEDGEAELPGVLPGRLRTSAAGHRTGGRAVTCPGRRALTRTGVPGPVSASPNRRHRCDRTHH